MQLYDQPIANFGRAYVIAELGSNHNGDMALARKLIDQAKQSGCDCVKFQSWSKDSIFAKQVYQENHFLSDDYRNRKDHTLESIVEQFSISERELVEMRDYCRQIGIHFVHVVAGEDGRFGTALMFVDLPGARLGLSPLAEKDPSR